MKISIISAVLSVCFLSGCNSNKNDVNEQDNVNYRPVRYENDKKLHKQINSWKKAAISNSIKTEAQNRNYPSIKFLR
jgi:PBP1b-binding outer membrane lipoprotein LpoB